MSPPSSSLRAISISCILSSSTCGWAERSHSQGFSPAQCMIFLEFDFNAVNMTVTIPQDKLTDVMSLVQQQSSKKLANIHELRTLEGRLFHIAQCCPLACFLVNCMLNHALSLPPPPPQGSIQLDTSLQKDIQWFWAYLPYLSKKPTGYTSHYQPRKQ